MAAETYELKHEHVEGGLVVRASGKFDRDAGVAVEELLKQHQGIKVLNLKAVEYISSSGIAHLVKLTSNMALRIASPAECVQNTLSLAGIQRILSIYEDEATACDAGN